MSVNNPFDFLWGNDAILPPSSDIKLPESGGTQGMAGEWSCQIVYRFWHDMDIADEDMASANGAYIGKNGFQTGAFHYFKTYDSANAVGKLLNKQYGPNTVWRWEIQTANIVNIDDELRAKFGETMSYEVSVSSLMSKKNRHELHMIALPSAIQALALMAGMMKEPVFDYESLRVDPAIVDEAYQEEIIGSATYENSKLWEMRKLIWAALGESDPKKYTVAQGGKFDTLSTTLAQCLNIIYRPTKIWARLTNVPDPRVDALSNREDDAGNRKRLTIPVTAQMWKTKEECLADLDITPSTGDSTTTNGKSNGPKVPAVWADYPSQWKENVQEILAAYSGKPKVVVQKALEGRAEELFTNYGATPEDYLAWSDIV
jgi:hypothetical protein